MRHFLLLLIFAVPFFGLAQGVNCADMDPICTDQGATFTANTGTTAEVGNDYGCLATQPNPSWYYFEISNAGAIDMSLTAPSDIDFIIYGPYPNLAAAQGDCGTLDAGDIVDCSYSATANETPSIPNAQVGEVYIMLITNYANTVQNVSLTQTGGTGATDCSVVANPPCFMSYFEANVSACDPNTDTYEITGVIDFEDPPTTGNLVVEDCNGNIHVVASAPFTVNAQGQGSETYLFGGLNADGQPCDVSAYFTADPTCSIMNLAYTAPICNCFFTYFSLNQEPCNTVTNTFDITGTVEFTSPPSTGTLTLTDCNGNSVTYNAPFTSPLNWAITGITPNGTTNCTVTATFSADPSCTMTSLPFNHPANCDCPVDAGTFSTSVTGNTTSTGPAFDLCFGDSITITPNGDFIPPADIGNPPGGTYNPGMHLLIYDCAPTIFAPQDFTTDPCFLGIWDPNNPAGPWGVSNIYGNNLTYYFMPLTLYDYVNYIYSYFYNGTLCYDLGPAYPVTFLEPITTNVTEDCFAGTATVTVSGGTPANDGSQFNVVPGSLVPSTASFVNTSASNGGTITIDGLVDGDNYSFEIVDDNGCPVTVSGTFVGMEDASFFYDPKYCQDDTDPLPTITGVPGGTFSVAPAGMVINTNTGLIDVSASTPGLYTITYQSPAATCWGTETFLVEINSLPNVVAVDNSPVCLGDSISLNETGGEATEWLWTTSGAATFNDDSLQAPTVYGAVDGETFTVSGTNINTGCANTANVTVTVNPLEDPTFTLTDFCLGDANTANITGTAGGTFSFNPDPADGSSVNPSTGEITNEVAGTTYNIQYLTPGACPDSLTLPVTVNPLPVVNAPDQTICEGDNVNITATGANTYVWSPGTGLNTTVGATVNASPTTTTIYTVTGTDANGCVADHNLTVTVNPLPVVDPILDQTLCAGDPTAAVNFTSPTAGASFDWTNNTTSIGLAASGTGNIASFNTVNAGATAVTATVSVSATANGCTGPITTFDIIVNPIPTVDPVSDQEICEGENTAAINFTGAVAGTQYDWTNSNTGIGVGANGTGNIGAFAGVNATNAPISGNFSVTPSAAGCIGTPESFVITVNPLPNATISGTVSVCENDPEPTITFTGSDGVAPYTFTYNINGGANQTVTSVGNTATVLAPTSTSGTFDYNLVSVQDASASNCLQNVAGTATVTVNPNPVPVITGVLEYCTGFTATLGTANAYNGYLWSNGATTPTADFTIADNPITVTVTDANGCTGTSAAVNVIENTTIVFPSTVEICQGEVATIHGQPQTVAGVYDATYTLPTGCDSTSSVTLVVNPLPVIDAGQDVTECAGAGVTLNATGAPTIVWDNGVINNQQFFPGVGTVTYTATGTDANGCSNTDMVDVTIHPIPDVDPVADQTVCNGDLTAAANFTGSVAGTTFDWVNDTPSIGLAAAGTGDIAAFTAVNNGVNPVVATITVTPTANSCPGTPTSFTITVNPTPAVDPVADQIVCNGDLTSQVVFTSTTPGTTFDWTNSDPSIGLAAASSGNIAAFNAVNNGAAAVIATITVTPTSNGCVGTPEDFTITVNPSPNVDPVVDQTVCNGLATAAVNFSGATPGTTFDWTNTNTNIGLGGAGTGDIPSFTATNTTSSSISGTITVTPTLNGCVGTPTTFTITVDAPPTMDPIADQELCEGENTAAVNFTSPFAGTTFDWINDNTGIGLGANGTGDIPSFTTTNGGATSIAGTVTVVPTSNGCIGVPQQFTITVNPIPVVDAGANTTVCDGDPVTLTATGANTYAWVPVITNGQPFVPTASGTYYVVGTDVNGCVNTDSVDVTVEPVPAVSFTADTTQGCEGLTVTFTNTTPGVFTDCFWSFSNGTTATGCGSVTVTFDNAGLFDATLTTVSAAGCSNTVTYTDYIYIEDNPVAAFTPSSSVVSVFDSQIAFNNQSTGAVSYSWDFGDGSPNSTQENPIHTFPSEEAGGYVVWLTAYSPLGCPDSTYRAITINEELIFYVPNTFTPDNDDYNQNWHVVFSSGYDPFDFNLYVFNRWGEVIWESHDASVGWDATYGVDGRPVQDGTYTWKIDFKTTLNDERIEVVGHVNVLR
ncbi:MAG: gliding motility-associated C-terminal domain-containing protein [Fluviicola sp.]